MTATLSVHDVSKHFGAIEALRHVSLDIYPGDVVGLVGDNGAGKSTLVKTLSGVYPPSSGTILFDGKEVELSGPADARALGVETVYQDLALVEELDVAGNLFLGREIRRRGWLGTAGRLGILDHQAMRAQTEEAIESLHVKIPKLTSTAIRSMSGGQRQATAIARTMLWGRKALILDEPTAALGVQESEQVMRLIERVQQHGTPLLVVSHSLPMVFRVCTRIIVLRLGEKVADLVTADTDPDEVVGYITGSKLIANGNGHDGPL